MIFEVTPRHGLRAIAVLALLIASVACRGDTGAATEDAGPTPDAASETIRTADGVNLDARLFAADPDRIVILLHMYQTNQESWFATARQLRDRGYSALTVDFRGYGASEGDVDPDDATKDTQAAIAFARERGFEHIVLLGASMGGTAAIVTAASEPLDGVLTLSAPGTFRNLDADAAARDARAPLAMIAARGDTSAELTIETFEKQAVVEPHWALLVNGAAHGTNLLTSPEADEVMAKVFEFLESVWGPTP